MSSWVHAFLAVFLAVCAVWSPLAEDVGSFGAMLVASTIHLCTGSIINAIERGIK